MPRNGSGVYSPPAGSTAVPNTTIESAKYNALVADLVQDANTARPVVAGGTGATTDAGARAELGAAGLADENTFTKSQTWAEGAAIASAATLTLGTDGNFFHVTGTTAITAISGDASPVTLVFDGALTFTHNGTSLILPGAANITTAAGDVAVMVSEGSGNWRCVSYQRANGSAGRSSIQATPVSLSGSNFVDFAIPSWAKCVEVMFQEASWASTAFFFVQLVDAGGVETTGYAGTNNVNGTLGNFTSTFPLTASAGAASAVHGIVSLRSMSADNRTWAATGQAGFSNAAAQTSFAGSKTLSDPLTHVRLLVTSGVNFDAGTATVIYW